MKPGVGIGVIIKNNNKILIGKRFGKHRSGFYSIPGGLLEAGESFEECAIREIFEETNLKIESPQFFCVTNNLNTFKQENIHNISIILIANIFKGNLIAKEPEKFSEFHWYDLSEVVNIPEPHFEGSLTALKKYIEEKH